MRADGPGTRKIRPTNPEIEGLRGTFDRDGYLVFESGISESTIDAAIEDVEREFRAEGLMERALRRARLLVGPLRTPSYRNTVRVQDAWTISDNVKAIARAPRVLELLRELYGRAPLPFQTLNFKRGSQQSPHSDTWHFNSEPGGFMCGVWLALEDIHDDCGPLIYFPGSHRLGEVTKADFSEAGVPAEQAYHEYIQSLIEREGLRPHYGTLRKGEALVWSSNLLHGGAPQRNPAGTRLTQVTHYFFESCRYWRPLFSDQSGRHYWEPTWVH